MALLRWMCVVLMFFVACGQWVHARPTSVWSPQSTRVFAVSMTRFKGGVGTPWGTKGRRDFELMQLFKARGVPTEQLVLLTDEDAEVAAVQRKFTTFVKSSRPGETLIFDFSSHGGYDPKSGTYTYSAYDGGIRFDWFFDAIERDFRGARVLMLADCCYSGGIVEIARQRSGRVAYACLSSTYAHNVGYSGWRFFDCLLRGFSGNPVVDLNGDGVVELDELARFAERHMAFVAEGRPTFYTSGGFDPRMEIARAAGPRQPSPVGDYVEALHDGEWRKAEVTDARPGEVRVHYTDERINTSAWLKRSQIRPFSFPRYATGAAVEVAGSGWERAVVMGGWEDMYLCRFDGRSSAWDEWVGPSRIRPASPLTNLGGRWVGSYVNSTGQKGDDSLTLTEDARGNLEGTWSDSIPVSGRRVDTDSARLKGETKTRAYTIVARLVKGVLTLRYTGRRLDSGGTYEGTVTLRRQAR